MEQNETQKANEKMINKIESLKGITFKRNVGISRLKDMYLAEKLGLDASSSLDLMSPTQRKQTAKLNGFDSVEDLKASLVNE